MAFVIIEPISGRQKRNVEAKPFITVRQKNSNIAINSTAILLLELEKKNGISFLYNDEDKHYYISKAIGNKFYPVRVRRHAKSDIVQEGYLGNNDLVLRLREAYGNVEEGKLFRLNVAPEPIKHMGDNLLYKLIKQQEG